MIHFNFLLDGSLAELELLAEELKAVFWLAKPDYSKSLFISSNFREIWGRNVTFLYKNILNWRNCLLPENRDEIYRLTKKRNTLINPNHTQTYQIFKPDHCTQWILDRTFNVIDFDERPLFVAGIALPIRETELTGEQHKIVSDRLDQYILQFYKILFRYVSPDINTKTNFYKKISMLGKREKEVLERLLYGYTAVQIARKFQISKRTVEAHFNSLKIKLDCRNKSEIISKAIETGLIFVFLPQ